jgi:flagellar motility protein MotE (MotC chaperone)
MKNPSLLLFAATFIALSPINHSAIAQSAVSESPPRQTGPAEADENSANPANQDGLSEAGQRKLLDGFCAGIVDEARERRYYLKQKELDLLLKEVTEQAAELSRKQSEFEVWVRRREEFAKKANQSLVEIYSNMKPDASAPRIAGLEKDLAASLLLAIPTRQASLILNEMDEQTAVELTGIMAASARKKDPK